MWQQHVRTALGQQPRPLVVLLGVLSVGLLGWMLVRTPAAHGDSGEYLLTVEAFANHATPDIRSQDVGELTALAAPARIRGPFGRLWHAVRRSNQGHWYTYHFWAYPLAVVPARLTLAAVCANPLSAAQVTNAVLLVAAAWFVLLAPWLDYKVARWWSLLTLVGPPAWFCVWPHPEVFCFSLVTVGLTCAAGRHFIPATAAVALASTQNPPLAPLAAALAVLAATPPQAVAPDASVSRWPAWRRRWRRRSSTRSPSAGPASSSARRRRSTARPSRKRRACCST